LTTSVSAETKERCPACGERSSAAARGEKNGVALGVCRACKTLYARRDGGANALDYDGYYTGENLSVPGFIEQRLDDIFEDFARYRRTNRLLDIGCGAGSILRAARRAGWDAEGLEVSRPAAEHARAEGFRVFCGELAEAEYPDAAFDVVTASEVLEHLTDPLPLLEEAARILRPGGLFWATTPHGRGLSARVLGTQWSAVCPPEHLQLFSLGGARRAVERAGFRRVSVKTRGCNPFEIWHALRHRNDAGQSTSTEQESVVAERESIVAGLESSPAQCESTAEAACGERFDRVATGYRLNEALLRNPATRALRSALNAALGATRLGDSIKISAEK
jgi:SAM-dependent methyltransferase